MYNQKYNDNHIIIVGAGGTGSWLAQFLSKINDNVEITIIDGDVVELKNLKRQNFVKSHIDKNKATALGSQFGYNIVDEFIKSTEELEQITQIKPNARQIIVGAVDNNGSRKIINDFMQEYQGDAIWIDGGNSERDGQVIFYPKVNGQPLPQFKSPMELYPDVFNNVTGDERRPDQISCAEQSESAPQNVAANVLSATTLFGVINKVIANEVIFKNEFKFSSNVVSIF